MKTSATILVLLALWMVNRQLDREFASRITEGQMWCVAAGLGAAFLASLVLIFAKAGKIQLGEQELAVTTPLGFCRIPYASILTIRRCRRRGRAQQLQIIFESAGERKILQLRPAGVARLAADIRRKCPHLSSSSDLVLVRQSGEGKLIHSA